MRLFRSSVAALLAFVLLAELIAPLSVVSQSQPAKVQLLQGTLRYSVRGMTSGVGGHTTVFFGGSLSAIVGGARILRNVKTLLQRRSVRSMQEGSDLARAGDQLDLSVLPIVAAYEAEVVFTLERSGKNAFRLKTGTVTWRGHNNTNLDIEVGDPASGTGTVTFSDRVRTQGTAPLDPAKSRITLSFNSKAKPVTFELRADVGHMMALTGTSKVTSPSGSLSSSVDGFPPAWQPIMYARRGVGKDAWKGRETWRDALDSQVLVEYELYPECDAVIERPAANQRFIFDDAATARLEHKAVADVIPDLKDDDLEWSFPDIDGSTLRTTPENRKGEEVSIEYEGLPAKNMEFGRRPVEARFNPGRADCEDPPLQPVRIFFMRDAKNNPDGPRLPNWFYYWKQTSAAQRHETAIKYSGGSKDCKDEKGRELFGYYDWGDVIYVCDLKAVNFNDVNPVTWRYTEGIDVFAITVAHEWAHLTNYQKWWKATGHQRSRDLDDDDVPDAEEPKLGLDPKRRDSRVKGIYDEHYLVYSEESKWPVGGANSQDWACPGKQSGNTCKP